MTPPRRACRWSAASFSIAGALSCPCARLALLHLPGHRHRDLGAVRHQPQPAARLHRPGVLRPRRLLRHRRLHLRHPDEEARRAVPARLSRRRRWWPAASPLVFGFFCVRLTRIYFAMLTLAFAQIVWAICFKWNEVTGGEQGMPEMPLPGLRLDGRACPLARRLAHRPSYFYFLDPHPGRASACGVLRRIVDSPFGRMLTTIRENPERAEFIGVNVRRYELAAFVARRRLRRPGRRPVRHLQPRRLPRLRLLDQVGRGADHDDPRRHGHLLGAGASARWC